MPDFSDHIVNQRFKQIFSYLEEHRIIKGKSDVAKKLGTYNHVINSILKGQRNITVDQLHRLFDHYSVNANYLFGQSEDMFLPGTAYTNLTTHPFSANRQMGRLNITLVPERAVAGYAVAHQEADWMSNLPRFAIPGVEGNDLIAFKISGDSMLPTITNGDIVVCENVEKGAALRDNHVYVVVTDVVVAKRIQQLRKGKEGSLRLLSDNATVYQPYDIDLTEVRQILKVKCRLTDHAIF